MKKILAVLMALILVVGCFAACGKTDNTDKTDLDYIKEKGKLVVGVTEFEPMDYKDKDGNWIGFDADLAKAFGEYIGVEVTFVKIDWDNKILELNGKNIDCVWNGMTLTDEVKSSMSCSTPYCNNAQIIVVPADKAEQYKTAADCKDLVFAVEAGSAGKDQAVANGFKYTEVVDQATALFEVASGTCDAAIIDSLMAGAMIGEGTGYSNLTCTASLNSEEYGVGFRKGSNLVTEFNKFYETATANGDIEKIAKEYGVQEALIK